MMACWWGLHAYPITTHGLLYPVCYYELFKEIVADSLYTSVFTIKGNKHISHFSILFIVQKRYTIQQTP